MGVIVGNQQILGCFYQGKKIYEAAPTVYINFIELSTKAYLGSMEVGFIQTGTSNGVPIMNVANYQENGKNYVENNVPAGYVHAIDGDGTWQDPVLAKNCPAFSTVGYYIKKV
ncbi:hypothetical protein [Levilactobacillus brevis]|uniref:hypothetical protein n=1 Tax=Levilactobacillus brevis TaxID=1580 RepID=UPI000BE8274B|nr:hypothetical protein [Levilactobacillus brevis]MCZ2120492.1 hypothetical protein [Levilactobacillus brevis]MCZ2125980.1 hypothetical protein [Levilactobacillus brevis]MCZ2210308.1 hypothetical protein [Levilactobacillus brevis]MCZ2325772.1 hypothetical protein [Levilactobacillus brevis]GEB75108.1 hypothetical protein LBR04_18470 [Levilactobacillus brevis]